MKPQETVESRWVGVDLHVHTPASKDYKGNRDSSEYQRIIERANQFGAAGNADKKRKDKESPRNPIGCVTFTDHNSVEGFRKYRQIMEETEKLSKAIRSRDPENKLAPQLEKDLDVLRSVRVLMGVEIKANPGIHVLVVFAEAVEPDHVVKFLEETYQASYDVFEGDPTPTSGWTLRHTLDRIQETFLDKAFVVFPHVDSSGGVYEDLKDFPQVRIAALTHPVVRALSFNRQETRERILSLFKQPDYSRPVPVSMVQSSDFHGDEGSVVGQPRTEVFVREGKPTYKNLREALREHAKVKCSIDFVAEEYEALVKNIHVVRFQSDHANLKFRDADLNEISESICGMLNSKGGIIEIDGELSTVPEGKAPWTIVRDQLAGFLPSHLEPAYEPTLFRSFQFSPGKVRVVIRILPSSSLHMANGRVSMVDDKSVRLAHPDDVEYIVSQNLYARFGKRFERTLERVSDESTLLSKLPRGISVILGCQKKVLFELPEAIKVTSLHLASDESGDAAEVIQDLLEKELEEFPFGDPTGNATIITGTLGPRARNHYHRFGLRRAEVSQSTLEKYSWEKIEHPSIVCYFGGLIGLAEPGYIISDVPAVLIQPAEDWEGTAFSLLAWMKCSFFIWYCAARLGQASAFVELQWRPYRIPVPKREYSEFLANMDRFAKTLLAEEKEFLIDINRQKRKGTLDSEYREKSRNRHNLSGNRKSLAIDHEVFNFLGLNDTTKRFIGQTLRDMQFTDFGILDELETIDQDD